MLNRAYALLEIKEADEDARVITGVASTPTPDRMADVVMPEGAVFKLPIPLLWQHDSHSPIGHVTSAKVTKKGIEIVAEIAKGVSDEIDRAWTLIRSGLVRGLSIGFRGLDTEQIPNSWGVIYQKWEWLELSAVTIPANAEATIQTIKSIDAPMLAASGKQRTSNGRPARPGVTGTEDRTIRSVSIHPKTRNIEMNIADNIKSFDDARAAKAARMNAIMEESATKGETLSAEQSEEYDTLEAEVKSLDDHLKRLRVLEATKAATAKPVEGYKAADATDSRDHAKVPAQVRGKSTLPKGIPFVRMVSALAQTEGNRSEAANLAKQWSDSSPEVEAILRLPKDVIAKTAVNAGTTSDTTWAAPLVQYTNLANEFIEYLRPLTILGRIQGFRRVPFKVKVPRQTAGASVNWVGEGKVKPLTSIAFDSVTLDHHKVAGIIPVTDELIRLSSPSAEMLVRDDLAAAIAQFIDVEFIDITNASTDVSPASITYGVSPITASGTTAAAFRLDVKGMFAALLTANQQISGGTWVMTQQQAVALMMMQNALGQPEFPGITINGGTLLGFPVVTSENIPAAAGSPADGYPITFVLPGEVLLADEGGVMVDISREASVQMETTPDSPATASTTLVSFWQHNLVGVRVERYITWKARRSTAAGVIQGAKYSE